MGDRLLRAATTSPKTFRLISNIIHIGVVDQLILGQWVRRPSSPPIPGSANADFPHHPRWVCLLLLLLLGWSPSLRAVLTSTHVVYRQEALSRRRRRQSLIQSKSCGLVDSLLTWLAPTALVCRATRRRRCRPLHLEANSVVVIALLSLLTPCLHDFD